MLAMLSWAATNALDPELPDTFDPRYASGQDSDGEIGSLVHGWSRTGDNSGFYQEDSLNDLTVDSSDNVYAVGSFSLTEDFGSTVSLTADGSVSEANHDGYLAKLNTHGEWLDAIAFTSPSHVSVDVVAINSMGDIAVAGIFTDQIEQGNCSISTTASNQDVFVGMLDSDLNCIWLSHIAGAGSDMVKDIVISSDATIFFAAIVEGVVDLGTFTSDGTQQDGLVVAINSTGVVLWANRIGGNLDQSSDGLMLHSDGSIWVGGDSDDNAQIGQDDNLTSTQDGYLLRIHPNGTPDWMAGIPGVVKQILERPSDSSIFLSGTFSGSQTFGSSSIASRGSRDIYIVEYVHPSGFTGLQRVGGMDVDGISSTIFDQREHIILAGQWGQMSDSWELRFGDELLLDANDYTDAFVASLDPGVGWDWAVRGTSDRSDTAKAVYLDTRGSLLLGGTFAITQPGEASSQYPDPLEFIAESLSPSSRQAQLYIWKFLLDSDLDGVGSLNDNCELGQTGWTSNTSNDKDGDGCLDDVEDDDDDGDGILDDVDSCPRGETGWISDLGTDPDGDGCRVDFEGPFVAGDMDSDGVQDDVDLDPADPNRRFAPQFGTTIEDLPVNASMPRMNLTGAPLLPMLGDDAGEHLDEDLAWFDVDGDGDYDLARSGNIYRTIMGELEISPSMKYCEIGCESQIAVGDVDGDGKLDIADKDGLHLNMGNGSSSAHDWVMPALCSTPVHAIALGDLDGDGRADLVVGHQGTDDCIFLTGGASVGELFGSSMILSGKLGTTTDLAIVDFDLDGDLDLLRLIKSSRMQLFFNPDGIAVMPNEADFETMPIQSAEAFDIGDLDGDGDVDVVIATSNGQEDRIYLNNQTGGLHNLTLEWTSRVISDSYRVRIGDVDWDGDLDFSIGASIYLNPSNPDAGASLDMDGDGIPDEVDGCIANHNYFSNSLSDLDNDGCNDHLDDDDDDGDGVLDEDDRCPSGNIGWTSDSISDPDEDGCDAEEDLDDDGDGIPDVDDVCPDSVQDRAWQVDPDGVEILPDGTLEGSEMGCHPGESDKDHDGVVDEEDLWPSDNTQSTDSDGDGFGDNAPPATLGDDCPEAHGKSTIDRQGCPDFDNDGWSDTWMDENGITRGDAFPQDPSRWAEESADTDFDTIPDTLDACPFKAGTSTEDRQGCTDRDGDGWSDADDLWTIASGADAYPDDPTRHLEDDGTGNVDDGEGNETDNSSGPDPNGSAGGGGSGVTSSSDMMMYAYIAGGAVLLLLVIFVVFMMRRREDDIDDYEEYESELMSDEEEVRGLFRKKKRKKRIDDHGLGGQKVKVLFAERPGQRAQMPSGEQRHLQQAGYSGEETRHDSYFGGVAETGYIGTGYLPANQLRGRVGDDGYEWLEFPEGSDRWWWRERGEDDWMAWE